MTVVIGTAEPCEKLIRGELRQVTPFFGADREGEFSQMGVGYSQQDSPGSMWGLLSPQRLIQSWRAMLIFSEVPAVEHGTLCACWYAAGASFRDASDVAGLAQQLGVDKLESVRLRILQMVPTAEELEAMLVIVKERQLLLDTFELRQMIEAGQLPDNPIIAELEQRAAAYFEAIAP